MSAWITAQSADQRKQTRIEIVSWADKYREDGARVETYLEWIGEKLGNASIVALGEGVHGASEPLRFRNALARFLVERKGFTAVALESGLVEGRLVHDYVMGGHGELTEILCDGLTWTFGELEENASLVAWLRDHNLQASDKQLVRFYGFDVPGSPGEPRATCNVSIALRTAMRYLWTVDVSSAHVFETRLAHLLPQLTFGPWGLGKAEGYCDLAGDSRDELTQVVQELCSLFVRSAQVFISRSSQSDYDWGLRAAIGAGQVDRWLRTIPLQWRPQAANLVLEDAHNEFLLEAADIRDRAMADNVDWILQKEGNRGKLLLFAHTYHICGSTVHPKWAPQKILHPLGSHLRDRYADRLVIIGNLVGEGSYRDGDEVITAERSGPDTLEAWAGSKAGKEGVVLDLREAPWATLETGAECPPFRVADDRAEPLGRCPFNLLLYMDHVSPALRVARG